MWIIDITAWLDFVTYEFIRTDRMPFSLHILPSPLCFIIHKYSQKLRFRFQFDHDLIKKKLSEIKKMNLNCLQSWWARSAADKYDKWCMLK